MEIAWLLQICVTFFDAQKQIYFRPDSDIATGNDFPHRLTYSVLPGVDPLSKTVGAERQTAVFLLQMSSLFIQHC